MKRSFLFLCTLLVCSSAFAKTIEPRVERAVNAALLVCEGSKVTFDELSLKLPPRFTGFSVRVDSDRPPCKALMSAILSPADGLFLGYPWPLAGAEGATTEEKLKNFVWQNMQMNVTAVIDRKTTTLDGLHPATLLQTTENGKMPLLGFIDPNGAMFFMGTFRRLNAETTAQRTKIFEPFFANAPTRGAVAAPVTIVEFSDFECPSCRRASGFADLVLEKHGDKVRYIRFDLPLTMHPWAFGAALAGRAIYRQKPDVFWEYKKRVYASQENLNAFSFWGWARAFAEDRGLDMTRFDADTNSEEIKAEILKGAGTALSNDIHATPTYMINGVMVEAGADGAALMKYVDTLLKQPATPDRGTPSTSAQ